MLHWHTRIWTAALVNYSRAFACTWLSPDHIFESVIGVIYHAQTGLFLINAQVFLSKAHTVPSVPVTQGFPKLYISIIMGCHQARLDEEERDVCLADSFIGKCLFGVGLSAWLLLLSSHFSLLAPSQLSFTCVAKQGERDEKGAKENCFLYRGGSYLASLRRLLLPRPWLTCALFRNHQLWRVLPHSRGGGGQEGRRDGDTEERPDAAAARREEDGKAQSQTPHGWRPWVRACKKPPEVSLTCDGLNPFLIRTWINLTHHHHLDVCFITQV